MVSSSLLFFFLTLYHLTPYSILLCSFLLLCPISLWFSVPYKTYKSICPIYACFFLSCVLTSLMCYCIFIPPPSLPSISHSFRISFWEYTYLSSASVYPDLIPSFLFLFLLSLQLFCPIIPSVHSKRRSFLPSVLLFLYLV